LYGTTPSGRYSLFRNLEIVAKIVPSIAMKINQSKNKTKGKNKDAQRAYSSPRNLGGIDPFGAFELPKDSVTDRALHHCMSLE